MIDRRWRYAAPLALLCGAQAPAPSLWDTFQRPPAEARPMVRWWWFGPAVEAGEIDREIAAIRDGGFGGVEVQPTYPLAPDGDPAGLRNLSYLSDPFLAMLRHAGDSAGRAGLRFDVTLGSGWPYGGPHVPVTQAAMNVRRESVALPAGARTLPRAALGPGESVLAVFVDGKRVSGETIAPASAARTALRFVAGRTGQQVKRAAIGAEGYVIDHVDPAAVAGHLTAVGDRLMTAFAGGAKPYAMFSDSLEAYGSSWTGDLPAEFRRRRGYDLIDHLPALFADDATSEGVRFDWASTLSELVDERYLKPITAWAHRNGTLFRGQVYGFPPPTLSSNALVDLPEGEGADWRRFTSTRWATSAAHLYGRPVVSSETWTWLHSPAWAATPLDMKVEADRHFLQGVNQLVGHGWPYSPPGAGEPGWAFYAAAALSEHNPWYPAMPAVNAYLSRVSAMLRLGEPDAAVAVYLPTEDAFADMRPARASVNEEMRARLGADLVPQILEAGQQFDFIDAGAVRAGKLRAKVLVLPALTRIDPAAYRAIAAWAAKGGVVIATGAAPSKGGGLASGAADTRAVAGVTRRLFGRGQRGRVVAPGAFGAALAGAVPATVAFETPQPAIGFVRRIVGGRSLYFVANTGAQGVATAARFAGDDGSGEWWDPMTGERRPAGTGRIVVALAPYQTMILAFGQRGGAAGAPVRATLADLSTGWQVRAEGSDAAPPQPGRSWTEVAALRNYSGAVTYARSVDAPAAAGARLLLDFGEGMPTAEARPDRPVAALEAPVRDAAIVRVNGQAAGTLWVPPWCVDVTRYLKPGANRVEVTVMNGAINALAGKPAPDRRLLTLRYGERFQDQDRDKVVVRPAGLLGQVTLVRETTR